MDSKLLANDTERELANLLVDAIEEATGLRVTGQEIFDKVIVPQAKILNQNLTAAIDDLPQEIFAGEDGADADQTTPTTPPSAPTSETREA